MSCEASGKQAPWG